MATNRHAVLLLVLCSILALTAGQQPAPPAPVIATAPAETDCILRVSPNAAPFVITLNHKWVTDRNNYTIAFGTLASVLGHRSADPNYATLDWPGINSFFCGWDPKDPTFIEEYHTFSNNQAWAGVGSSAALEYAGGVQAAIRHFDTWWLSPTDPYSIGLQEVVIQFLGPENHYFNQDGRNMTGFEMNNPVDYIGSPLAEPLPYCVNKTLRLTEAQRRKPIAIVFNATTVSKGDRAYRSSLEALTQLYRNIPCVISFVSWKQPGREWPSRSNSKHFGSMMFNSMECLRVAFLTPSDQNLRQAVITWLASVKELAVTPFYFPTEPNIPASLARGLKALRPGLRNYRRLTMRPREWHAGYIVNSVINLEWVNSSLSGLPIYEPLTPGTSEIYSLQG